MDKIKIAIVDDHNLFRKGLRSLLEKREDFEISFEAENGKVLLQKLATTPCDVILLDLDMPVMNGFEALELIQLNYPNVKVLAITLHDDDVSIVRSIEHGANGFLAKNDSIELMHKAIIAVYEKDFFFTQKIRSALQKYKGKLFYPEMGNRMPNFTKKEREVLSLICMDYTSKEIANKIGTSVRTIEWHRKNLIEKTQAKSTAGIVFYAVKNHMVDWD